MRATPEESPHVIHGHAAAAAGVGDDGKNYPLGAACQKALSRAGLELLNTDARLTLTDGRLSLCADFTDMRPRLMPGSLQRELLVKAAVLKGFAQKQGRPLHVVDATAGLGTDSLLLAAAGCEVTLIERNPVIAALVRDALARASAVPDLSGPVARMHLREGDSLELLPRLGMDAGLGVGGAQGADQDQSMDRGEDPAWPVDVVYLDPMFPGRSKSALVKKKFQLLGQLEEPCTDERALLEAALATQAKRIVVKRPKKGPYLAGVRPSHSICGKAIRYDCLVPSVPALL